MICNEFIYNFKGGGQKDGWDPVFSGGAGEPGEEVQETGENLGNGDCIGDDIDKRKDNVNEIGQSRW